jgi:predicted lysophospholipase L1 biosynthesis ABC-type transport system permease subunit
VICDEVGSCSPRGGLSAGDRVSILGQNGEGVLARLTLSGDEVRLPTPPTLLPELENAMVLVDPDRAGLHGVIAPARVYAALTDGSLATEQRIRTAVLETDPAATVSSVPSNYQLRLTQGAFTRSVLLDGALLALIIAVVAEVVAGLDALWDRRRHSAMLLSTGIPVASLRRAHSLYLVLPLLVASVLGTGIGALIDAGMDRAVGEPVSISPTLLIASGLVAAFTSLITGLIARRGISMAHLVDAVRTE